MDQSSFNFSPQKSSQNEKTMSVSQLNESIKGLLEGQFQMIWVKGEISNFKPHSSGHFYFSLKDKNSQISSVMFRGSNSRLKFRPKDGMEVIVRGRISVYTPRGNYQILCETMEPVGEGGLQQEFEKLKLKLKSEGLFDASRKKRLPFLPFKIALVTSPTGAAVKDMIQVLSRRHPAAEIIVVPSLTQGERAAADLLKGLKLAEKIPGVEVIITGRGGGSLEDMWCFNDEALARYISSMEIPLISAVGHEIDFTICDFVADLRAPTPSAAAELVCKNVDEVKEKISQSRARLFKNFKSTLFQKNMLITQLSKRITDPRKKLGDMRMRIDELMVRFERSLLNSISSRKEKIRNYDQRLSRLENNIKPLKDKITFLNQSLLKAQEVRLDKNKEKLSSLNDQLRALSPLEILQRGYSIVRLKKDGKIITDHSLAKKGEELEVQFDKGFVDVEVKQSKLKR